MCKRTVIVELCSLANMCQTPPAAVEPAGQEWRESNLRSTDSMSLQCGSAWGALCRPSVLTCHTTLKANKPVEHANPWP